MKHDPKCPVCFRNCGLVFFGNTVFYAAVFAVARLAGWIH